MFWEAQIWLVGDGILRYEVTSHVLHDYLKSNGIAEIRTQSGIHVSYSSACFSGSILRNLPHLELIVSF